MAGRVLIKPGVEFTTIAPAGIRLLEACKAATKLLQLDLTITSACDGMHDGPTDPHYLGEAYDVRSHDMPQEQKQTVLEAIMRQLQRGNLDAPVTLQNSGLATLHFFGWIENPGEPTEHFHFQRRNNTSYTMEDYLNA